MGRRQKGARNLLQQVPGRDLDCVGSNTSRTIRDETSDDYVRVVVRLYALIRSPYDSSF